MFTAFNCNELFDIIMTLLLTKTKLINFKQLSFFTSIVGKWGGLIVVISSYNRRLITLDWLSWLITCLLIEYPIIIKWKKSCIREIKHFSTDADSSIDTKKNPASKAKFVKNLTFFVRQFTPFISKSIQIWDPFFSLVFPKDMENLKSLDIGLREVGAKIRLNEVNKGEKNPYKYFFATAILDHFWAKIVKSKTTSFHYFSPKIWNP